MCGGGGDGEERGGAKARLDPPFQRMCSTGLTDVVEMMSLLQLQRPTASRRPDVDIQPMYAWVAIAS